MQVAEHQGGVISAVAPVYRRSPRSFASLCATTNLASMTLWKLIICRAESRAGPLKSAKQMLSAATAPWLTDQSMAEAPAVEAEQQNAACKPNTAKLTAHISIWLRRPATSHVLLTSPSPPSFRRSARAAARLTQCSWTGVRQRPADKHSSVPTSGSACCNSSKPGRLQPHVSCRHSGWQTDTHLHSDTPTRTHAHWRTQASALTHHPPVRSTDTEPWQVFEQRRGERRWKYSRSS